MSDDRVDIGKKLYEDLVSETCKQFKEITQLKSQLEREQKCVELAVSAIENSDCNCKWIKGIKTNEKYYECLRCETLTKIKSLREPK